jgi:predicted RNA methylase
MRTQQLQISHLTVQLTEHPEVWSPLSAVEMLSFLVEHDFLQGLDQQRVLDFGTGSGVVGIVCGLLGATSVTLSDYSAIAAQVAEANARQNGLKNVAGVQSDRFQRISPLPYDLIISNPPVQPWLLTDLQHPDNRTQVAAWNEAGADGRLVLDALLTTATQFLSPGGRLITSSSSRHGHRQTQQLLETHWPQRWRQIYAAQHALLPDYHGPYIKIWQHLQALDGDLRIYQLDDRDRRFARQTDPEGQSVVITELTIDKQRQPVLLRPLQSGEWVAESPQGDHLLTLSANDDRLPGKATTEHWYYEYYLFEVWQETLER